MAAAIGNTYSAKGRRWADAIERAIAKRSRAAGIEALDELAEKLLLRCDEGDMSALKELGDRYDGKPAQVIANEGGKGFAISLIERVIVDPDAEG